MREKFRIRIVKYLKVITLHKFFIACCTSKSSITAKAPLK